MAQEDSYNGLGVFREVGHALGKGIATTFDDETLIYMSGLIRLYIM